MHESIISPACYNLVEETLPKIRILIARYIEERVDKSSGCWIWTGPTNEINGFQYGRFSINGQRFYSHRLAYRVWVGSIPTGATVTQTCGQTLCCNPDHLESFSGK